MTNQEALDLDPPAQIRAADEDEPTWTRCCSAPFAGIFLRSSAFGFGGRLPAAAPVAQRQGYFRVGGWPKVPLWPKTRGITPKTNGYKPAKLAPVA